MQIEGHDCSQQEKTRKAQALLILLDALGSSEACERNRLFCANTTSPISVTTSSSESSVKLGFAFEMSFPMSARTTD